jgi:endonuclease YncB( thermonuclease family)
VIDGDTLAVNLPDAVSSAAITHVRLWGIDCPEMAHFGDPEEPWAREAEKFAQAMLKGHRVRLFLEPHQPRDSFGRVLAHVEMAGDGRLLNEALLEEGLATADDRWPHSRLTRYAQVELAARRRGVGVWAKP